MTTTRSSGLLIDTSAPVALTDSEVRDWASGRRLFISSPMADTREERRATASAIEDAGATAIWFERFGGREDDPERAYVSEVDRADAYVGILRARYGRTSPGVVSATHAEYRRAQAGGKPVAVWVAEGEAVEARERGLLELIDEVRAWHTTGAYDTAADLAAQVRAHVGALAAEDVSPWVKLGDLAFRASRISLSREHGRLEARLRSGPLLDAITSLIDKHVRSADRQLTVRERSVPVRITDVATTMDSSARTAVTVEFTVLDPPAPMGMAFSSGGKSYTAEELIALRLREQLFGEAVSHEYLYFWCDFEIDATPLRRTDLPESTIISLTRLLVTEALVGGGYVRAIRRIDVAPRRAGGRRVTVEWTDRKVYENVEPGQRSVEGIIRG